MSIRNGLPSNFVYRPYVDKNGYLWLATDKGAVKYNGYNTIIFNSSNGIANDDIWDFFEDNQGRMWLKSISDEFGYVLKNKYHKTYAKEGLKLYPTNAINIPEGIAFVSFNKSYEEFIGVEKNDTIKTINLRDGLKIHSIKHFLHQDAGMIMVNNGFIFYKNFKENKWQIHALRTKSIPEFGDANLQGDYIFPERKTKPSDRFTLIANVIKDSSYRIRLQPDEDMKVPIYNKGYYYLTTSSQIYQFDSNLTLLHTITADSCTSQNQAKKIKLQTFIENDFCDRCITTNDGVYIQYLDDQFKKTEQPFVSQRYVGNYKDSIYYFWDNENAILSGYTTNKALFKTQYRELRSVKKIIALNANKLIALNDNVTSVINNGRLSPFFDERVLPYWKGLKDSTIHNYGKAANFSNFMTYPSKTKDIVWDTSNNNMNFIGLSFGYYLGKLRKDSLIITTIDSGRYDEIIKSPQFNFYLVYGKNNIVIQKDNKTIILDKNQLQSLGINDLKQIVIDDYGNFFIKTRDKLFIYKPGSQQLISLLLHYNLNNAKILLHNSILYVTGRFGIVFLKVSDITRPYFKTTYLNFKTQKYTYVYGAFTLGDSLYLNTDMGCYAVSLKNKFDNSGFNVAKKTHIYISSQLFDAVIKDGDTVKLISNEDNMDIDFINAYGDGTVKYSYIIDDDITTKKTAVSQVSIPTLIEGKYHQLKLMASDDSWHSDVYTIYLYVQPHWWQTSTGKIWLAILIGLGAVIATTSIILTTRYVLNKRHARENKYLELELKSIYAQLNPHFIFNTLSNIIYYIKKDRKNEAYKYLNTFSKLLRSYIKSSRNKWLPLNEEIENIENYIILQQSRFENKFDYNINIDAGLDTEHILLPSLLLQPLVENAIHHGLQQKEEKGILRLSFKKTNNEDTIIIVIDDDGIGRSKAKEFAKNSLNKKESFGSNLIEDLITIYKRYELFSIDIDYHDKAEPLTGTIVTLTIKNHQ